MAILLLSLSPHPPNPPQNPNPTTPKPTISLPTSTPASSKRNLILKTTSLFLISLTPQQYPVAHSSPQAPPPPPRPALSGISNTKNWFQFFGDGFAIRVPPQFQDVQEPEDYNSGLSLYGDKVKPKTFAARFASADGYEVVSVVIRPSNSLKITFLEAKDITDLGSLKEAAKIFIPVGSTVYSARAIRIKEEEGFRTYYFYEFGVQEQHAALVAAVNGGKTYIAGATAPQSKWNDDGVKLRSAAISMTVL
ncbi:hypothetical protein ACFX13_034182 [Malus domestica]|uniref:uncharacterized protein LOC126619080 isoform X1 n=1 Tax=Malus sylvestris TaxID=3752 RepID=UPI0010AAD4A2|nr:uncharacterized protein LOC103433980 isoform X1 [Malus domestica]XP_050143302.1 uncharacterized protein LOC126619080 isoform X1 [Malus sylvestris]